MERTEKITIVTYFVIMGLVGIGLVLTMQPLIASEYQKAHGQEIEQHSPSVYFFDISQLAELQQHNIEHPDQHVDLFDSLRALFD